MKEASITDRSFLEDAKNSTSPGGHRVDRTVEKFLRTREMWEKGFKVVQWGRPHCLCILNKNFRQKLPFKEFSSAGAGC